MLQFELTEERKVVNKFKISPIPTEKQIKEIADLQNKYTFYYKVKSDTFNVFWIEGEVSFPNKLISAVLDILVQPVEVSKDPEQMTCRLKDEPSTKDVTYFTDEILLTSKQAGKIEPIIDHFFSDKFSYAVEGDVLKVSYKCATYRAILNNLLKDIEKEYILLFTVEDISEANAVEFIRAVKDELKGTEFMIYQSKYLEGNLKLLTRNEPWILKVLESHAQKIKRDAEYFKQIFEKYETEIRQRLARHWAVDHDVEYAQLFDNFYNEMRRVWDLKQ